MFDWTTEKVDDGGDWGFNRYNGCDALRNLVPLLKKRETAKWSELEKQGSHPVACDRLIVSARQRLAEIDIEVEELYSLRIDGRSRFWGVRENNLFRVLWFDQNHEVCPSPKKHT